VSEVAVERPDGPVVEALEAGMTVVVISPNQVKNLRGSYGPAGNKDDRFDPFVLADTLHADRARCARFPTFESLACLTGAASSTRQPAKTRVAGFR
jgi:transposase